MTRNLLSVLCPINVDRRVKTERRKQNHNKFVQKHSETNEEETLTSKQPNMMSVVHIIMVSAPVKMLENMKINKTIFF